LSRKQFIEYKLKLTRDTSTSEKADLISELTEVKANLERLMKDYERRFNESYTSSPIYNPTTTNLQQLQQVQSTSSIKW
jgi:hypothetical protein